MSTGGARQPIAWKWLRSTDEMGDRGRTMTPWLVAVAMALAITVVGCGGDSGASDASQSNEIEAISPGEPEPSKAFLKSKKKFASFGEEASAKEREDASKVLEENLKARKSADFATQCDTLSSGGVEEVEEGAKEQGVDGGGCAKELKARAEPLERSAAYRKNTMTGPIDALRFKGARAYALYHGTGGQDYAMPMEKVDGEWKVGSLIEE
jgi:hypothetical protein